MIKAGLSLLILFCLNVQAQTGEAGFCTTGECKNETGLDELTATKDSAQDIKKLVNGNTWAKKLVRPEVLQLSPEEIEENRKNARARTSVHTNGKALKNLESGEDAQLKELKDGLPLGNTRVRPSRHGLKIDYRDSF
jgi:hypothetical protein